jgi:hypothetical protein
MLDPEGDHNGDEHQDPACPRTSFLSPKSPDQWYSLDDQSGESKRVNEEPAFSTATPLFGGRIISHVLMLSLLRIPLHVPLAVSFFSRTTTQNGAAVGFRTSRHRHLDTMAVWQAGTSTQDRCRIEITPRT